VAVAIRHCGNGTAVMLEVLELFVMVVVVSVALWLDVLALAETEMIAVVKVKGMLVVSELVVVPTIIEVVVWLCEATTMNVVEAWSPPRLPLALIVYPPGTTLATLNEAVKVPLEMVQVELLTGLPEREQAASADKKPEPET